MLLQKLIIDLLVSISMSVYKYQGLSFSSSGTFVWSVCEDHFGFRLVVESYLWSLYFSGAGKADEAEKPTESRREYLN